MAVLINAWLSAISCALDKKEKQTLHVENTGHIIGTQTQTMHVCVHVVHTSLLNRGWGREVPRWFYICVITYMTSLRTQ